MEAAEHPPVVGLKVPDRTLVTPADIPCSSADSSVGAWIVGRHIKIDRHARLVTPTVV